MREWATFCKADGCNRRTKSDCGFCWQHHDMKPAKYLSNPKPMTLEQARQDAERETLRRAGKWLEKNNNISFKRGNPESFGLTLTFEKWQELRRCIERGETPEGWEE